MIPYWPTGAGGGGPAGHPVARRQPGGVLLPGAVGRAGGRRRGACAADGGAELRGGGRAERARRRGGPLCDAGPAPRASAHPNAGCVRCLLLFVIAGVLPMTLRVCSSVLK